jgi:hypothetical protein
MDAPQSWNRYAYVLGNPLALIDPLGFDGEGCMIDGRAGFCVTSAPGDPGGAPTAGSGDGGLGQLPFGGLGPSNGDPGSSGGGGSHGGNSSGTSARIQCATQFGRNHSLAAGVGAIFGDKVGNNFVTQLFLGNTVSSLAKIGTDIFGGTTPTGSQIASMAIKGAGQGIPDLPPTPSGRPERRHQPLTPTPLSYSRITSFASRYRLNLTRTQPRPNLLRQSQW